MGAWLVVRGTAVGACTTGLALGGHAAGGGGVPPLLFVLGLCFSWSFPRLLVLLAGLGWLHRSRTVRQLGDGSAPPATAPSPPSSRSRRWSSSR